MPQNKAKPKAEVIEQEAHISEEKVKTLSLSTTYQGPLPPPSIMRGYDDICPGAARMILDEFQANSQHIRDMESMSRKQELQFMKRGQIMAFVFGVALFGIIVWTIALGQFLLAGVGVVTALVSVITAFLKK